MAGFKIVTVACLVLAVAHGNPTLIVGGGGGLVPGITHGTGRTVNGVTHTVGNIVDGAGNLVGGIVGKLLGKNSGGAVNGILDGVANTVKGVGHVADNTVSGVGNVGNVPGGIGDGGVAGAGLAGVLDALLNGVTRVAGNADSILKDLSELKVPGAVDDVLNTVGGVTVTVGDIVDALIPGAGSAIQNLVVGILKTVLCVAGSPGLTGGLLGDRRGGFDNSNDIPGICTPNYGTNYGMNPYNGGYDNAEDLIQFYELEKLYQIINDLIKKFNDGKGSAPQGSEAALINWLLNVADLLKEKNGQFDTKDIGDIIVNLTIIFGGVSNCAKEESGDALAKAFIKYITEGTNQDLFGGIDLNSKLQYILEQISQFHTDSLGGAIQCDANSSDNGNNSNNSDNGQSSYVYQSSKKTSNNGKTTAEKYAQESGYVYDGNTGSSYQKSSGENNSSENNDNSEENVYQEGQENY